MGRRLRVALLAAPDTLEAEARALRSAGVHVVRIQTVDFRPTTPESWLQRLPRNPSYDTLLVTSRTAVALGLVPWLARFKSVTAEVWVAGPRTAQAVRTRLHIRAHQPRPVGSRGIVASLRRGARRSVLYLRSDLAGPGLARELRAAGHRVREVTVYRTVPAPRLSPTSRGGLLAADVWVAASPSSLQGLRRHLGRPVWHGITASKPLVVLGVRTASVATRLGFLRVRVAAIDRPQRFTRRVVDEARRAAN